MEYGNISFPGVSGTGMVTAGCKWSPEAVEKRWEKLFFGAPGKKELPRVIESWNHRVIESEFPKL